MPNESRQAFTALLLAGGQSRRMGSDKAWLKLNGKPLWRTQLEKLAKIGARKIVISCRHEQGIHCAQAFPDGTECVFDPEGDDLGPMGAIYRVLKLVSMPVIVLAVDMPLMTDDFISHELCSRLRRTKGFFFTSEAGFEPLAGCYAPVMLPLTERCLLNRELSLQWLIRKSIEDKLACCCQLPSKFNSLFSNANTQKDWKQQIDFATAS